ncbi:MAG: PAS domain S-box protein, partial [Bacteroidetes bacterium]|nr:PAS domain S-box protein [Bacteroidota bacterium]
MSKSDASLHILLIEDDPDQVLFLKTTLRIGSGSSYALTHAGTLAEGLSLLDDLTPDIILLDLHLPDSEGLDTPRRLLARAGDVPVIIFSGNTDVTVSLEAVRLGAQDYLLKGEAREPLFSRAIMYAIERKRFTRQLQETHRQLQETHRQLEERNAALETARAALRDERDMFVLGPTVLFRRGIEPGFPITYVSRNVSQFGYAAEELTKDGSRYDALVVSDDRESFHRLLETRLDQGAGHVEHEYRILDARGEIVWLHEVVRLQRDVAGKPVAQLAYVVDITHRVRAETHLGSTRRQYESMLGGSNEIVFEVDPDGRFVSISPVVQRMLGWNVDELAGRPFAELVSPSQREGWENSLASLLGGTLDAVEYPLRDAGGEEHLFHIGVRRIFDGGRVHSLAGLMTDVSERRKMEYSLRNAKTIAQQYLDIAGVVFLSLDLDGHVSLVNRRGCELLGYREHEMVGRDWFDLCIPETIREDMRGYFFRIVEGKEVQPETHENRVRTRSGDERLLRWHNAMLHDARGAVIGVLSSGEDITERRRIEEEVRGTRELIELALWGADLGAWEWEVATDAITLNQRAREMLGLVAEDDLPTFTRLREDTLPKDDVAATRALLDAHLAGDTVVYQAETWMIAHGGEWKWVLERGKVVETDAAGLPLRVAGTWLDLTERKYAEIAMEDSEKKFRLLAENSTDVIWTTRADLSLTFVSPSIENLFGYTVEEMMDMQFTDIIAERARVAVEELIRDFLETVETHPDADRRFHDELPLLKKDGNILWAEVVASPVFDIDGRLVGVHGNTRDIHSRKLAQLALAESEEKYRLLVQNQTDLVVKVDLDGKFLFVSPSYCRMFGKTEEELLSQTFFPMVHEDDRISTLEAMKKIFDPPYTSYVEQRAMTRDGWRWLGWLDTAVFDDRGEITAIIGVGRDVTERRLAERALIESEKRLRTVVSNLPVIMFTIDHEGIFTLSEGMGLESLGLQPGEVVGQSVYDVYADDPAVTESVRRALSGENLVAALEIDGKSFETWYSPVIGEGGRIEQVIGVAVDVTARKQTEEELDRYRNHLEELVEARTLDLERAGERLRRFRFALDSAVDNIYIIDPQTMKYVDTNDSAVQALGYSREELLTMGPADIQTRDQRDLIMDLYGQVRDGTLEIGMFETGHMRKDGT